MDIEQQLTLSYYENVAAICEDHGVFLVRHRETGKFFVKKILPVYNISVYQHLQEHPVPNVPKIEALAKDGDSLIVIEEYISGDTLQDILEQCGEIPEDEAAAWILQLCEILTSLHACTPPIVHRDIKPSNVILSPDGVIKLLDFNAAKFTGSTREEDTTLLGTKGYAAPEQYGFGTSDARTDIYALGVLLNTLLTGKTSHTCTAEGRLAPVIEKCLQLSPDARFPSAQDLSAAIRKAFDPSAEAVPKEDHKDRRRFLPPGFRTGSRSHAVIGIAGYLLILACACELDVKNVSGKADLLLNRIFFALAALSVTFFICNYLDVQSRLPLCKSENKMIRIFGICLFSIGIFALFIVILILIENAWFPHP